jgi:peptidoglycan/xylan/chitin deacetylase (PgdA/CDA1 family)
MRDFLKRIVTTIAPRVPDPVVTRLLGRFCPIFMLHRVGPERHSHAQSLAHIEACLTYMRRHRYRPLSLSDLGGLLAAQSPLPERSVVFTVDDGFIDHYEYAAPLFARYDTPLTCFVITDFLDGKLWPWDDQLPYVFSRTTKAGFSLRLPDGTVIEVDLQREKPLTVATQLREKLKTLPQDSLYDWIASLYTAADVERPHVPPSGMEPMSWNDARRFVDMGHTIAPHTRSHRIVSQLSDTESQDEISGSARRVTEQLGVAATVFAYPTGRLQDFSARDIGYAAAAGIRCAVSTEPRATRPRDELFALPRFSLPDSLADFAQYLSFVESAKARLRSYR